ncbi:MAG: aminodeoxychorismate/anthranilate synthase component II [Candidatus Lightella neohaematopini]|nr:aminodeoxychorismate/anthranilate synthase component II [Candidatus Lightella neohaematopini]MCV2528838.1 aminodeoxychorismate/anthranilate synthase component II [Candidatus Lightella neohaematopini]
MKILLIDNYDSFNWNTYHYIKMMNINSVLIYKHDVLNISDINSINPTKIIILPGPGSPNSLNISSKIIEYFSDTIPILGICLGHQIIGKVFGAKIIRSNFIMHGKQSIIIHNNNNIFYNINNPFKAVRYNSLTISTENLPSCLLVNAWSIYNNNKEIMAIKHRNLPLYGIQFHPESILSEFGIKILYNFIYCKY